MDASNLFLSATKTEAGTGGYHPYEDALIVFLVSFVRISPEENRWDKILAQLLTVCVP